MILKTEQFKEVCSKILIAVSKSDADDEKGSLELTTVTDSLDPSLSTLKLAVTNGEYYVSQLFKLDCLVSDFHAVVNASKLLKLVAQITTDDVELNVKDTYLEVKANGKYKIPFIAKDGEMVSLHEIKIDNVTSSFSIPGNILNSIVTYNSKNIGKGSYAQAVQKMYYIDEKGCITFNTGACVNSFTLEKPVKLLLSDTIIKLFKLFKDDAAVDFNLGFDPISSTMLQTKIKLNSNGTSLTAIVSCDDTMMNSVPVDAIRNTATFNYPYSVVLNKEALMNALSRLDIFSIKNMNYGKFSFSSACLDISDLKDNNTETLNYQNEVTISDKYDLTLDLNKLKTTLLNYEEDYITLLFGNSQAVVVKRGNIYNVLPECRINTGE